MLLGTQEFIRAEVDYRIERARQTQPRARRLALVRRDRGDRAVTRPLPRPA